MSHARAATEDDNEEHAMLVDMLMAMGFDVQQAELALEANDGNVDRALDDLCSGIRFSPREEEAIPDDSKQHHAPSQSPIIEQQHQPNLVQEKQEYKQATEGGMNDFSTQEQFTTSYEEASAPAQYPPTSRNAPYHPSYEQHANRVRQKTASMMNQYQMQRNQRGEQGYGTDEQQGGTDQVMVPPRVHYQPRYDEYQYNQDDDDLEYTDNGGHIASPDPKVQAKMLAVGYGNAGIHPYAAGLLHSEPRVGAVAVLGTGTDLEARDFDPAVLSPQPVPQEVLAASQAMHSELIVAELVSDDQKAKDASYWTRKRLFLASLVLLVLVGGAVIGTILALGNNGDDKDQGTGTVREEPQGTNVTAPSPTQAAPPPTEAPLPTEDAHQDPTAAPTENHAVNIETVRARSNSGDRFADFISISRDGTTIASGAEEANYVEVFRLGGALWSRVGQKLEGDGQFGRCVNLNADGSMLIVGAWNNDDAGQDSGHAKVFRLEGDEWKKVGKTLTGDSDEDRFGWFVSIADDGRTIAISAREADPGGKLNAGLIRVFTLNGDDEWSQLGSDIEGERQDEQFGRAMAMSSDGRRLAIGTTKWNGEMGIVRVFDYISGNWNQVGQDLTGENSQDWYGSGVSLSANATVLAIGANGVHSAQHQKAGLIQVFHLDGSQWNQCGNDIVGEGDGGELGLHQVALSNDGCSLVAGASHLNSDAGAGYIYKYKDNIWTQIVGEDKLRGDRAMDRFGESVSISGDGTVAVFGAAEKGTTRPGYFRVISIDNDRPC